jgi:hypothetical protein
MTQEQKRIKIAQALNWTGVMETYADGLMGFAPFNSEHDDNQWLAVPDYFYDINATQEFKHVLEQRGLYWQFIEKLNQLVESPAFSTAAQRAEAFGLTLGLWKADDK